MNPSPNREELLELLLRKAAGQATDDDDARIEALIEAEPALWDDYNTWQAELPAVREAAGYVGALHAEEAALPDTVRDRLMAHVHASFSPAEPEPLPEPVIDVGQTEISWRWALVPAGALAIGFIIALANMNQTEVESVPNPGPEVAKSQPPTPGKKPLVTVALLDIIGQTRGPDDPIHQSLQRHFSDKKIANFDRSSQARQWQANWPEDESPAIKILYNAASGELTLTGKLNGETKEKIFTLTDPAKLPTLIDQAKTTMKNWLGETAGAKKN